jgi:hypothetical protein
MLNKCVSIVYAIINNIFGGKIFMDVKNIALQNKTETLGLRITKSEKDFVEEEAKKRDTSVTNLIRSLILDCMVEADKNNSVN